MSNDTKKQTPHTFVMSASRGTTGLDGKYESFDAAIHFLQLYSKSFPGEIINVSIIRVDKPFDEVTYPHVDDL
jgi:hypothetical protein